MQQHVEPARRSVADEVGVVVRLRLQAGLFEKAGGEPQSYRGEGLVFPTRLEFVIVFQAITIEPTYGTAEPDVAEENGFVTVFGSGDGVVAGVELDQRRTGENRSSDRAKLIALRTAIDSRG